MSLRKLWREARELWREPDHMTARKNTIKTYMVCLAKVRVNYVLRVSDKIHNANTQAFVEPRLIWLIFYYLPCI